MAKKRKYYRRKKSTRLGELLKRWRLNAHLTLRDAASRLGLKCRCPEAYLCMIEKGERPVPERILMNVPNVYSVPVDKVLKAAYFPQYAMFSFFDLTNRPTALPKPFEDYLQQLDKQDKMELTRYAAYLLSSHRINKH